MIIKTSVSFKAYALLLFKLTYRKRVMLVIISVAFAMLAWIIIAAFSIFDIPEPTIYQYIPLALIAVVQPLVIYYTVWTNYHSGSLLKERLEIELTSMEINITGESFYMKLTWEKIYQVVEMKNWFLIYQNTLSAIILPKSSFTNDQIDEFRHLLKAITGLNLNLAAADKWPHKNDK